jgi:hypothetical protein
MARFVEFDKCSKCGEQTYMMDICYACLDKEDRRGRMIYFTVIFCVMLFVATTLYIFR